MYLNIARCLILLQSNQAISNGVCYTYQEYKHKLASTAINATAMFGKLLSTIIHP